MEHFRAHELVCPHVYRKYGEASLKFADPRLLLWLTWFRGTINRPVIINTYIAGGRYSQRGYRCNLCSLVKEKTLANEMYLSAHTRFQAIDFNVDDMYDEEIRQWLERHKSEFPVPIRVERDTVGWIHIDVSTDLYEKLQYFNG